MISIAPKYDLTVLHIGSGSYRAHDEQHSTFAIWRTLAAGFRCYDTVGRAIGRSARWSSGNLTVHLKRRIFKREAEFLITQLMLIPLGFRLRADVVVSQSPVGGGLAAIVIAFLTGAGSLIEIHGNEYVATSRRGSRNWFIQRLSSAILSRATLVRVLSPRMGAKLIEIYGARLSGKIRVLPPRVDLSLFRSSDRGRSNDISLKLVMVGAVNANKGQLRLISALQRVDFPVELHIVGDGPQLESCRTQITEANLRVVCHGRLTHREVVEVLHSADVFVMYSRTEGTPRAIMEAMATGLPIITTNAGFCADIVEHGKEGFVLGSNPDREILDILGTLRSDRNRRLEMGDAARQRVERDFDADLLFPRYRALIAEAAGL